MRYDRERFAMLAEKFFLFLEAIIKNRGYHDGSPRVRSTAIHVPIELSAMK
jgi:hypothetical protein